MLSRPSWTSNATRDPKTLFRSSRTLLDRREGVEFLLKPALIRSAFTANQPFRRLSAADTALSVVCCTEVFKSSSSVAAGFSSISASKQSRNYLTDVPRFTSGPSSQPRKDENPRRGGVATAHSVHNTRSRTSSRITNKNGRWSKQTTGDARPQSRTRETSRGRTNEEVVECSNAE